MPNARNRPKKTAVLVAQRIVDDIFKSEKHSGDGLPAERLMLDQYGVGRGTLRESLRFLELQGVISLKPGPGGGPVVEQPDAAALATSLTLLMQFSDAPLRTIVEARAGLEPMMARLAAERIPSEQLEALTGSAVRMRESISDHKVFLEEDERFHRIIAHGSGNAVFGFLIDALLDILEGSSIRVDHPENRRIAVAKAHGTIAEAIASSDPGASAAAMSDHIDQYVRYAEKTFPEVLDEPITWSHLF